jgi:hypothetical protein
VSPTNPQTAAQGNTRQIMSACQMAIKRLGPTRREELRKLLGYRWNSEMLSEMIGKGKANWTKFTDTYTAFTAPNQTAWDTAAESANFTDTTLPYATDPAIQAGMAAFVAAAAIERLFTSNNGTNTLTAPSETNSATVCPELVA